MSESNRMPPKKRLLVLTSTFPRWKGDDEPPFVFELSRRLQGKYRVHILAPHARGSARDEFMDGLRVTRFRYFFSSLEQLAYQGGILSRLKRRKWRHILVPFFVLALFFALVRLLRQYRFDVIHAHWILPQGLLAVLARPFARGAPALLCTSHGGDWYGLNGFILKRLKLFALRRVDLLTVVSRQMRKDLAAIGIGRQKISVMPMGVDLQNTFVPSPERRSDKVILFVGRLVEKKGLRYLIEAMPTIIEANSEARLRIVGDGPERSELENRAIELGIDSRVRFLGSIVNEHLAAEYQAAAIFVFPSIIATDGDREGFGLVLVEALGCECAAVVSDLPAMRDIFVEGRTALSFPQKNAASLAERVNTLLADERLRSSLSQAGRQQVFKKFDWEIVANRYADLLDSYFAGRDPCESTPRV